MLTFIYNSILIVAKTFGFRKVVARPIAIENETEAKSVYDIKLKTANGKEISFSEYKGKKILIVNTSSKCGFTPQLQELQQLHEKYGEKVEVLGFPSDNFGMKESKINIEEFCQVNYGVTFKIFSKGNVKGEQSSELFSWLFTKEQNGWNDKSPSWNFCKYLINEKGELEACFSSAVSPLSREVIQFLN